MSRRWDRAALGRQRGPLDGWVERAITQSRKHRLVLPLHQLAHDFDLPLTADVLRVARLDALQDATTIHEQMGDDVSVANA